MTLMVLLAGLPIVLTALMFTYDGRGRAVINYDLWVSALLHFILLLMQES